MKWKSKRQKEKELRLAGWKALASVDALFTTKDISAVKALQAKQPPSLDQRFNDQDVRDLQTAIHGKVVLPTDADYHRDRQMTILSIQEFPQLIVYCETFQDVRCSLAFAHKYELAVAVRSGGHSTAGFSVNSEMVIDVGRLNDVVIDPRARLAFVGAGADIGRILAKLDLYGLHVPLGSCHDVGIAGFMQGGGYGFTSRRFGMNCDNVVEVLVMLANRKIVVANQQQNSDLFWAIRGGTGGNFGVLLQITYQLHEIGDVWGFGIKWPIDTNKGIKQAAAALVKMQTNYIRTGAPHDLGYMTFITWQGDRPYLLMRGMFLGSEAAGMAAIHELAKSPGASLENFGVDSYLKIDKALIESPPGLPQVPDLAREEKQSGYINKKLTHNDWINVINTFLRTPNRSSLVCIEPYGGQIKAVAAGANAFTHRDVDMDLFLDVFWMSEEQERTQAIAFLDDFITAMRPYFNGESYQNYPRRTQADYRKAFWGRWFHTLLAVKDKYDHGHFFRYAQDISPDPNYTGVSHSLPQLTSAIVYETY
jgi:FAD binding domain/Berberine and berberine like